jgi:hypothetical protein
MPTMRICLTCLIVLSLLSWPLAVPKAAGQDPDVKEICFAENQELFELVGQVKNAPPAGPGLPATSVQYGYLSSVKGLEKVFSTDDPTQQNEKTARLTFYNESVTQRVIHHGSLLIINREGTSTIYFNDSPNGDLTTPNPDSFRSGKAILATSWQHQVIFEPAPLSGHFFVHFENTVTSTESFAMDGQQFRIGKAGDQFRINVVGDPDPGGKVNGKFAGYAVGLSSHENHDR